MNWGTNRQGPLVSMLQAFSRLSYTRARRLFSVLMNMTMVRALSPLSCCCTVQYLYGTVLLLYCCGIILIVLIELYIIYILLCCVCTCSIMKYRMTARHRSWIALVLDFCGRKRKKEKTNKRDAFLSLLFVFNSSQPNNYSTSS